MNDESQLKIALLYEPDGYVEQIGPSRKPGHSQGLMGRHVAGHEFLDAYLTYGDWDEITAVVRSRKLAEPFVELCRHHPSSRQQERRLRITLRQDYVTDAGNSPERNRVLHIPCPPDAWWAWNRRAHDPAGFAMSGVTHTLSSPAAVHSLCELVTAPFESYDTLICTSQAVKKMVQMVTTAHCDYLRERFGGAPSLSVRLETIPLGVNPHKFRPATPDERKSARQRFHVQENELLVLCVGRLSHHAKGHPFPIFHAVQQAARATQFPIHLVFAGWAAHPSIADAYRSAARYFAPSVRVSFLDGQNPQVRSGVWQAADLFISLPDNIQETFGLVILEAMASALPVVASDWNGYCDLVLNQETGFLVPTHMIEGATMNTTRRLLLEKTNYDHFLAECSQAVTVDPVSAAEAVTKLVQDPQLRMRMGQAGRDRVLQTFTWEHVIRSYERLWKEQRNELNHVRNTRKLSPTMRYPAPECTFAGYPTNWLDMNTRVAVSEDANSGIAALLTMPLTNLAADTRCSDLAILQELLRSKKTLRTLGDLCLQLEQAGVERGQCHTTLAWLMKYGILQCV